MTNYSKPTLQDLRNRAIADINARLTKADANLPRRILNILAIMCAGVGDEILRRVEYLLKQSFLLEADPEFIVKHGQTYNIPRKMATKADGFVAFQATAGSVIPARTIFRRADNVNYVSTAEVIAPLGGTATIQVRAENAGNNGNASAGTIVSLLNPIPGVQTKGEVGTLGITGGSDIETIESWQNRLIFYVQNPPTGGSKTDYEMWAREVAGVTRAWCYPIEAGLGTVTVRFMMDDTYPTGIPQTADINRVKAHIEALQPATATVFVEAPIPDAINFTFTSLTPNTTEVRTAIEAKLKSLIQSSSVKPGSTLPLSQIRAAISNAAGVEDFALSAPNADIVMSTGHIAVLGSINYPTPGND